MSIFRHSSALWKNLFLKNTSCIAILNVGFKKRRYGTNRPTSEDFTPGIGVPPGYDYTHEDGENQVQILDESQPLTPELRAKLAAKYNLRPEDYIPMAYGNSDITLGDYPLLPVESALERDPHYDWDDPFFRRNWGEPIFHEQEIYTPVFGVDRRPLPYELSQMWKPLVFVFVGYIVLFYIGDRLGFFFPAAPKQYPEFFAEDQKEITGSFDYLENRGTDSVKYKDRKLVVNYTFEQKNSHSSH